MSLWFYRYRLIPKRVLSVLAGAAPREGALIRAGEGFADLHPWPELGDAPLDEQLRLLARGETTSLTRATLRLAEADGEARRRGVSLFEGVTIPESHWPGPDPPPGFDTVKLKEPQSVDPRLRIRLDLNGRLTPDEYRALARHLPREQIEFVEDPCAYDPQVWGDLRSATGLRLALDLVPDRAAGGGFDVLVFKPARSAEWPSFAGEIVVTSYMDHPVGQLGAAWIAATHRVSPRCGLVTHVLYEHDPFIERMHLDGMRLIPPEGTGIGFDDLMDRLPWRKLT
jgi:O-succinylbenzoate synthase